MSIVGYVKITKSACIFNDECTIGSLREYAYKRIQHVKRYMLSFVCLSINY